MYFKLLRSSWDDFALCAGVLAGFFLVAHIVTAVVLAFFSDGTSLMISGMILPIVSAFLILIYSLSYSGFQFSHLVRLGCTRRRSLALTLGAAAAVRKISPSLWKKAGGALSSGALNTLVLSMPFLQEALSMDFLSSLGYALGTGAAFWLASVLLHSALQICSHKDVPRAYRGLPAALIYAGLICLAFCGFSGGRFF